MVAMDIVGMLNEDCRRPILPQPAAPEPMRCKRRLHGLAYMVPRQTQASGQPPPTAVAKRNERERRRVKMVNHGFNSLRQHVPNGAKNKKLSKVETLRSAIEYIRQLQDVVTDDAGYDDRNENYAPSSAAHYQHLQHLQQYSMMQSSQSPQPSSFAHLPFASSSGCSTASSPTPSLGSTESQSPAAPEQFSSSEEDFLGITTWLA